jgi:hypothetical protein
VKRAILVIRSDRLYTPHYPKDVWPAAKPTGQTIFLDRLYQPDLVEAGCDVGLQLYS